jgi:large subunit ribosomal protein L1
MVCTHNQHPTSFIPFHSILQASGPYRNMDETVELAINLNVDPRRPGQALRGSLRLPHGTGKTVQCLVFSSDPELIAKAQSSGHLAGGDDLIQQISKGEVTLDQYSRALATQEWISPIQKALARVLGPRGLMPNAKTNTVFEAADDLWETLQEQSNTITYRTDSNGILQFPIGKSSFEPTKLMENMQAICQTVQDIKPEQYGKGKKKKSSSSKGGGGSKVGKNVKYWLRASLSSTQGKGVRMDLRTVDPTSPFFMKEPE